MRREWVENGRTKEYLIPPLLAVLADAWLYRKGGSRTSRKRVLNDRGGALQAYIDKSLDLGAG